MDGGEDCFERLCIKQHIDALEDLNQAAQRLLVVRAGRSKPHSLDDVALALARPLTRASFMAPF